MYLKWQGAILACCTINIFQCFVHACLGMYNFLLLLLVVLFALLTRNFGHYTKHGKLSYDLCFLPGYKTRIHVNYVFELALWWKQLLHYLVVSLDSWISNIRLGLCFLHHIQICITKNVMHIKTNVNWCSHQKFLLPSWYGFFHNIFMQGHTIKGLFSSLENYLGAI